MTHSLENMFAPVLIVEDEDDHARLITRALKETGRMMNTIIHLRDGEEAVNYLFRRGHYQQVQEALPALILLDVKMPMKNGFEVLAEIKQDQRLRAIPVVMLTTTSTSEDIEKAMSLGANDFIVKPVKFSDFMDKVGQIGYYWGIVSDTKELFR